MPPSFMILTDIVPASAHKQEIDDIVANMSKDDRMINSLLSVENADPYLKIKKIERDLSKIFFCLIAYVYIEVLS
jgi:hypothetical protein